MSGGSSPETVTQTTDTAPWGPQQDFLKHVFREAQAQYAQGKKDVLPDQMVAGLDPNTLAAHQQVVNTAVPAQQAMAQQVQGAQEFGFGKALDVENNQYVQGAISSATRPIIDDLLERALPAIRSDAVVSGNLGSTRQGVAEGITTGKAAQAVGDVGRRLAFDAYQRGLGTFERTLALAPQSMGVQTMPAISQDAVGQQLRAYEQELLNEEAARLDFEQNRADMALRNYAQLVSGPYGGTTITTGEGQRSSPYAPFGMAMSGAALGFQMGGPLGAGLGAGAGLIFGLLN